MSEGGADPHYGQDHLKRGKPWQIEMTDQPILAKGAAGVVNASQFLCNDDFLPDGSSNLRKVERLRIEEEQIALPPNKPPIALPVRRQGDQVVASPVAQAARLRASCPHYRCVQSPDSQRLGN